MGAGSGAGNETTALLDYLSARGTSKGPLFVLSNGNPLTHPLLVSRVRSALSFSRGFEVNKDSGHSFRIGAATTALQVGISDAKINMLGRWDSSAYQLNICICILHGRN